MNASEWWSRLWDTSEFVPRSHCGVGMTPELIANAKVADFAIALAYILIPIILTSAAWTRHRRHGDVTVLLWIYVAITDAFVLSCGATHVFEALMFDFPAYRAALLSKQACAALSLATVAALRFVVPSLIDRPSEAEVAALRRELDSVRAQISGGSSID